MYLVTRMFPVRVLLLRPTREAQGETVLHRGRNWDLYEIASALYAYRVPNRNGVETCR